MLFDVFECWGDIIERGFEDFFQSGAVETEPGSAFPHLEGDFVDFCEDRVDVRLDVVA